MSLKSGLLAGVFAAALLSTPAMAQDAATVAAAEALRDKALSDTIALDFTREITTRFGPRPAGSKAEQDAAAWAADWMRANGFENVRIENFPLVGWERGEESIEVVGNHAQKLIGGALGHSIPTPAGGIEAEVVRFETLEALEAAPAGSLNGKIVYIDPGQMVPDRQGSGYGPRSRIRAMGPKAAADQGAVAFLIRSVGSDHDRMPHTGTTAYHDGKVPLTAFSLAAPDADQLNRLIELGEPVRVKLFSSARIYDTHSQNVIGDITGTTRPQEVIVLGSHLDSWDIGTGAFDDAAGGGITIAAAKTIAEAGRPARTIRVILYGSEEVYQPVSHGNGGGAYVRGIGDGIENHIIAGESDLGADNIYAVNLPVGALNSEFARIAYGVLAPLGIERGGEERSGGADVAPLARGGVPVFALKQDATRYFDLHHTANDTFDKLDPVQVRQNVAAWTALIKLIADSDVDFRALAAAQTDSIREQ
ncbi:MULTISPECIES: M28 family peptidase [unclassified Brevundimonas]|uniref:M28 family peptidase n=1 Tax=unclassified Brevundimonas TaxID=2622653 RepID=UPI0025B9821F|nr:MULTISPECIES: M28 family peptidase [unclassified Brevundimonas]